MNQSPHPPQTASVAEVGVQLDPLQSEFPVTPPFFSVSVLKFAVMSLCTLGFYDVYWFYKNWLQIRARGDSNFSPALRTLFAVFYCHLCFSRIYRHGKSIGVHPAISAGFLATSWMLFSLTFMLPAPYALIARLANVFMLPVQAYANSVNLAVAPGHSPNSRFSGWNWLAVVIGGLLFLLMVVGTFAPVESM